MRRMMAGKIRNDAGAEEYQLGVLNDPFQTFT